MYKHVLVACLGLFSISCFAIDIIAPRIEGLIEKDGKGVYQNLIEEASKRTGLVITEHVYPQKRALRFFFAKKHPCIYAYTDLAVTKLGRDNVIASFPLGSFKQYIFTAKGEPAITRIVALKGLRVGGVLGDTEQDWFNLFKNNNIHYALAPSIQQNVDMLILGRIDAMVSFMPDAAKWSSQLSYDASRPLFSAYDRLTCHINPQTRDFIRIMSSILKQMKQDGTSQKILGDLYLDYDDKTFNPLFFD